MATKQAAERIHVRRRALQRWGLRLGRRTLERFVADIRNHRARLLWRTSCSRTVWAVMHDGQWLPVAYNRRTGQIITILPREALDGHALPTCGGVL